MHGDHDVRMHVRARALNREMVKKESRLVFVKPTRAREKDPVWEYVDLNTTDYVNFDKKANVSNIYEWGWFQEHNRLQRYSTVMYACTCARAQRCVCRSNVQTRGLCAPSQTEDTGTSYSQGSVSRKTSPHLAIPRYRPRGR